MTYFVECLGCGSTAARFKGRVVTCPHCRICYYAPARLFSMFNRKPLPSRRPAWAAKAGRS